MTGAVSHFLRRHSSQVDQLRSELMQERSERHDLEMDKSALERQVPFRIRVKDARKAARL